MAGHGWESDSDSLRLTRDTLITILTRFGVVLTGFEAFRQQIVALETRVVNIAARRIRGVGAMARLMILRIVAGVFSVRNLYILSCALCLDPTLRAFRSPIRSRLVPWLGQEDGGA